MTAPLVVATYNVHRFRGADGVKDPARTVAVIEELDADVIAVQEVSGIGESAVGHVVSEPSVLRVPGYRCVAAPISARHGGFGNALLTRFPVTQAARIDLSHRRREPRTALDVTLDLDGVEMRVVATHLGLRHAERRSQVSRLIEHLERTPDPFLAVLGDFNDWLPGSPALRLLEARLGVSPRPRSYPAFRPIFALDRVWVHPGGALLQVHAHKSRRARRASDHLPVVARVARPEEEEPHLEPPAEGAASSPRPGRAAGA